MKGVWTGEAGNRSTRTGTGVTRSDVYALGAFESGYLTSSRGHEQGSVRRAGACEAKGWEEGGSNRWGDSSGAEISMFEVRRKGYIGDRKRAPVAVGEGAALLGN